MEIDAETIKNLREIRDLTKELVEYYIDHGYTEIVELLKALKREIFKKVISTEIEKAIDAIDKELETYNQAGD